LNSEGSDVEQLDSYNVNKILEKA